MKSRIKPLFQVSLEQESFVASAKRHLYTHLEPIVDIQTGKLVAVEALMRGMNRLNYNSPPELLDAASSADVLMEIELQMAKKAIKAVSESAPPGTQLFLNIDGRTLPEWQHYADRIEKFLHALDMSPVEIILEISEAHQVLTGEPFETAVSGLQGRGFRIAIDDFGTGVSGLRMLYEAQPQFLKIDRFFIQKIPIDAKRRLVVQAVSRLASTLGAQVIAEGVETRDEYLACRRADCELVQGYYLKKPDADASALELSYSIPNGGERQESIDIRVLDLAREVPVVPRDVSARVLFEKFRSGELGEVVPIVDEYNRVLGVILLRKLRMILGGQYSEALTHNPAFRLSIMQLLENIPSIDTKQELGTAINLVADKARDGVLLIERGECKGYLSPYDLMQLANSIHLAEAAERNPLTGMLGNHAISTIVTKAMGHSEIRRCFVYIDITNFKPFNDRFGFDKGDQAILALSNLLLYFQSVTSGFTGHIGGDDFFIAVEEQAIEVMLPLLKSLTERFHSALKEIIDPEVFSSGSYIGKDRSGKMQEIPLISCVIGGLIYEAGDAVPDPSALAEKLASIKEKLKMTGNSFSVERAVT